MHATFGFPLPLVIEGSLFFPIGKTLLYIYIYGLDPFDHTVLKWIQTIRTREGSAARGETRPTATLYADGRDGYGVKLEQVCRWKQTYWRWSGFYFHFVPYQNR